MANVRKCLECSTVFTIPMSPSKKFRKKFCSQLCRNKGNAKISAHKRGDMQRGRGIGKTYTKLYGRHMHRVIMEQHIDRKLDSNDIVHHIDGNKKNNDITNLQLMTLSEHTRLHALERRNKRRNE